MPRSAGRIQVSAAGQERRVWRSHGGLPREAAETWRGGWRVAFGRRTNITFVFRLLDLAQFALGAISRVDSSRMPSCRAAPAHPRATTELLLALPCCTCLCSCSGWQVPDLNSRSRLRDAGTPPLGRYICILTRTFRR